MIYNNLLIILGNQLFPIDYIKQTNCKKIFIAEDYGLCKEYKHHKLKILMFFLAMRKYRDELINKGYEVYYHRIEDKCFKDSFENKLNKIISDHNIKEVNYFEIVDKFFSKRIKDMEHKSNIAWRQFDNPMFLLSKKEFKKYGAGKNNFLMANFYKLMRKKFNILIKKDGKPVGEKWSFDDENRKKILKNTIIPNKPKNKFYKNIPSLKKHIIKNFNDHPGNMDNLWFPVTRQESLIWLDKFFKEKFTNFGTYEDAMQINNNFLFHSNLSSLMNMGLLTPKEIIDKAFIYHKNNNIPLNSLEGFIRQIIGWREFIKGIYDLKGEEQIKSNFWNHNNSLSKDWYEGTTGIEPLDDTIIDCINYGYTHHIPRLMIVANLMTLSRIHPDEIYKWFMEMFIDSADWVMVPNVYGMATFADGGILSTKPYICGSNYLLKMSNYKKGKWSDIIDGLYWKFISDNLDFFKTNPRLSIMVNALNKMNLNRKKLIFKNAEHFIKGKTIIK